MVSKITLRGKMYRAALDVLEGTDAQERMLVQRALDAAIEEAIPYLNDHDTPMRALPSSIGQVFKNMASDIWRILVESKPMPR